MSTGKSRHRVKTGKNENDISKWNGLLKKEVPDLSLTTGAKRIVLSGGSEDFLASFGQHNDKMKEIFKSISSAPIELRSELKASLFAQMSELIGDCWAFLKEQLLSDAADCRSIAFSSAEPQYTGRCRKPTSLDFTHFRKVSFETANKFVELNEEQLNKFLSSVAIKLPSVEKVYQILRAWVLYDKENNLIFNLLSKICFIILHPKFIVDGRSSVSRNSECYKLFCSWLQSHVPTRSCLKTTQCLVLVSGYSENDLCIQIFNRQSNDNNWSIAKMPSDAKVVPENKTNYCTIVINNKLFVIGGCIPNDSANTVQCLDLETKKWTKLPPMKQKRYASGAAELNGELYVIGGNCHRSKDTLKAVEKYNFTTRRWKIVKQMNFHLTPRISTAVLGGLLYVFGNDYHVMQCYDPIGNQWTEKAPKAKLRLFGFAAVGEYLYAVGGQYRGKRSAAVVRYDPSTDSWTYVCSLETPVCGAVCASLNNRLIVCGGDSGSRRLHTTNEYNPETKKWESFDQFFSKKFDLGSAGLFKK